MHVSAFICECVWMCVCVHREQCGHTGVPATPLPGVPVPAESSVSSRQDQQGGQQAAMGTGGAGEGEVWGQQEGVTLKLVAGEM